MNKKNQPALSPWYVMREIGQLGFIIAVPLATLIFAGHWLDVKLGYRALFVFVGLGLALIISSYTIYQKIKKINQ